MGLRLSLLRSLRLLSHGERRLLLTPQLGEIRELIRLSLLGLRLSLRLRLSLSLSLRQQRTSGSRSARRNARRMMVLQR